MVRTPDSYSWDEFTVRRMGIFAKAFRAFDHQFPAETEIKGKGKPVPVQAY